MKTLLPLLFLATTTSAFASITFDGKPISEENKKIITEIIGDSPIDYVNVTGLSRTPLRQAELMYQCSERNSCAQYGSEGRKVLDIYNAEKVKGSSKEVIINKMHMKVVEVLPTAKELGQLTHLYDDVIAIDLSKNAKNGKSAIIDYRNEFLQGCKKHPKVKRCFGPGEQDPDAFHIEIEK